MINLVDLYQKIKEKTLKENDLIIDEDYKKLEELLKEKNHIIEEIKKVERKTSDQTEKKANQKIQEILESAVKIQSQNLELLSQKKGETKTKFLELYRRQKSIKGYHNAGQQEAKFFDKKR